jgi:hypothetical protein
MGARVRTLDWSQTPVGPMESWPQSLRGTIKTLLASRYPRDERERPSGASRTTRWIAGCESSTMTALAMSELPSPGPPPGRT